MNKTVEKLTALNKEWEQCKNRIEAIKKELEPVIIERFKQLNYVEDEFEARVKTGPRTYEKKKAVRGYVRWNEDFIDEDTGTVTTIERYQIVMEDGVWYVGSISVENLINWAEESDK